MGIPRFLSEILPSAGRKIDLAEYAAEGIIPTGQSATTGSKRRPLRIGVDVSTWIHRAAHGHGDMLGDERHLSNYGRAELHFHVDGTAKPVNPNAEQEMVSVYVTACTVYVITRLLTLQKSSSGEVLVVLDGATPPIKQREVQDRSQKRKEAQLERDKPVDPTGDEDAQEQRLKGNRRAGAGKFFGEIVTNVIEALRLNSIPFLVSPYESDGQLAYLANQGFIDLIITEDSDLVAYGGASPILFKATESVGEGFARGILLRKEDLGAASGSIDLMDFSPIMLAVMFSCAGSDYCSKLQGIGIVTANNIVRSAFLGRQPNGPSPLAKVFELLYRYTSTTDLSNDFKKKFENNFLGAVFMYRHPVVFDPIQRRCILVGDPDQGVDPELATYKPYVKLCQDTAHRSDIAGIVFKPPMATYIAEGWIDPRTLQPLHNVEVPEHVQHFIDKGLRDEEPDILDETQGMETQEEVVMDTSDVHSQDQGDDGGPNAGQSDADTRESQNLEGGADGQMPAETPASIGSKRKAPPSSEAFPAKKASNPTDGVVELIDDDVEDNLESQAPMLSSQDDLVLI